MAQRSCNIDFGFDTNQQSLGAIIVSYTPGAFKVLMEWSVVQTLEVAHLVEIGSFSSFLRVKSDGGQ